jgi:hypothetical protein
MAETKESSDFINDPFFKTFMKLIARMGYKNAPSSKKMLSLLQNCPQRYESKSEKEDLHDQSITQKEYEMALGALIPYLSIDLQKSLLLPNQANLLEGDRQHSTYYNKLWDELCDSMQCFYLAQTTPITSTKKTLSRNNAQPSLDKLISNYHTKQPVTGIFTLKEMIKKQYKQQEWSGRHHLEIEQFITTQSKNESSESLGPLGPLEPLEPLEQDEEHYFIQKTTLYHLRFLSLRLVYYHQFISEQTTPNKEFQLRMIDKFDTNHRDMP